MVGLYPNNPHEEALEAMCEYLENRSDKLVSTKSLCDLASIILKNNYFENGELKHHQKRGTAIVTKFTPPYSNLFMAGYLVYLVYGILMTFFVYGPKVPNN